MAADTGTGSTVTFGTSGWAGEILDINFDGFNREAIDTTHLGTTTARTFMPSDLYDPGELTLEVQFDGDDGPPIAAAETITITFPLKSGDTTAGNWAGSGFVTGFSFGLPLEGKQTGTMTIKFTGAITETDAA